MIKNSTIPIIGFTGYSGSGKTTLLIELIKLFKQYNIKIGAIKHTHHYFEIDCPGKDSYELRKAGANQVLIGSQTRWALMGEEESNLSLVKYIEKMNQSTLKLILVEGCNNEPIPKIEIYRSSLNYPLLSDSDTTIIAIATDDMSAINSKIPLFDLRQPTRIADFIIKKFIDECEQISSPP